jgi:hypothetical protein
MKTNETRKSSKSANKFRLFGRWKIAPAHFPKIDYFLEQENEYKKESTESKRDDQPTSKREGRSATTPL